eukprot:952102-Alexandrium_andersonii.AAC.1
MHAFAVSGCVFGESALATQRIPNESWHGCLAQDTQHSILNYDLDSSDFDRTTRRPQDRGS